MWNHFDVLITDDPKLLESKPAGKKSVKIESDFNKTVDSDATLSSIKEVTKEFDTIIKKLYGIE